MDKDLQVILEKIIEKQESLGNSLVKLLETSSIAEMSAPDREELEDLRKFKAGISEAFSSPESFTELATKLGYLDSIPEASHAEIAEATQEPEDEAELTLEEAIAEALNTEV